MKAPWRRPRNPKTSATKTFSPIRAPKAPKVNTNTMTGQHNPEGHTAINSGGSSIGGARAPWRRKRAKKKKTKKD